MKTLYLRNVPDEVTKQLGELARREGMSVSAYAVRELAVIAKRANNAKLLDLLPDLDVSPEAVVAGLDAERGAP